MLSIPHMIVVFIVVLVVFGPQKLPELARGLGKLMAEFRKASTDFKMAFEEEMRTMERQAREVEYKKAQAASVAAGETPAIEASAETAALPETIEPVVTPVTEAVARSTENTDAAAEKTASEEIVDRDSVHGNDGQ